MRITIILVFILFFSTGCSSWVDKAGYQKKEVTEFAIAKLQKEKTIAVQKAVEEVIIAKDVYTNKILENFQYASDWLYGARLGVELVPDKTRLWNIIDNRLQTSASYAPAPSRKALEEMNKTLKEELDTVKISNEELDKKYQTERNKADIAVKKQASNLLVITEKENQIKEIDAKFQLALDAKQSELNNANNIIIANEKQKSEDKIYIEKNKRLIMSVCGALALAALAGAIWSPVSKKEFGIFAAVLGTITIIIPFVQPAHVAIGAGVIFLIIIGFIVKKYGVAQKSSENLINFVQTIKDTKPEIYNQIKTDLVDANSKYSTNSEGKTVKVEDKTVEKHVESVLKDYEKL